MTTRENTSPPVRDLQPDLADPVELQQFRDAADQLRVSLRSELRGKWVHGEVGNIGRCYSTLGESAVRIEMKTDEIPESVRTLAEKEGIRLKVEHLESGKPYLELFCQGEPRELARNANKIFGLL